MSIEQHNVVDFVRIDNKTGEVVLSITDHLDWNAPMEHIWQLQEKIKSYIRFIESGEMLEKFPKAKDQIIVIEVVVKELYPNTEVVQKFIEWSNETLKDMSAQLRLRLFKEHVS